jgi:hypothetical protein
MRCTRGRVRVAVVDVWQDKYGLTNGPDLYRLDSEATVVNDDCGCLAESGIFSS